MARLILLNKPYGVLSQFTDDEQRPTLARYVKASGVYPAGRLDMDSEGLLLLTDDGKLQAWISEPRAKQAKHYWVQVEGLPDAGALQALCRGVELKDGLTAPAEAQTINEPELWPREPPIRSRAGQTTSWIELIIREGRNRQVRRMTAAVGHPTLRLVRHRIGPWSLGDLQPGQCRQELIHLPTAERPGHQRNSRGSTRRKRGL